MAQNIALTRHIFDLLGRELRVDNDVAAGVEQERDQKAGAGRLSTNQLIATSL
jgi:hypothetical protein